MREKYESLSLAVLKELAKSRGLKGISTLKKAALVERMLQEDEKEAQKAHAGEAEHDAEKKSEADKHSESVKHTQTEHKSEKSEHESRKRIYERRERPERRTVNDTRSTNDPEKQSEEELPEIRKDEASLDSGEQGNGILEVMPDGYGFIRCENYLPGDNDVYVAPSQIRRFNLKTGDIVCGNKRIKSQGEKFSALLYISTVNGYPPYEASRRKAFEDLTPIFPNQRLRLETRPRKKCSHANRGPDLTGRQGTARNDRSSPPKAGKDHTDEKRWRMRSIHGNDPDMHLIILLIDERPEEVTDIKEAIDGDNVEVIYSTFDELPEHHKRVSEMVIERAKRLVEHGKDVTILLDSITRLARAYNLVRFRQADVPYPAVWTRRHCICRNGSSERRATCVRAEA